MMVPTPSPMIAAAHMRQEKSRTSVATAVKITYKAVVTYVLLLKAWLGLPSFPILAVPTPMMDAKSPRAA